MMMSAAHGVSGTQSQLQLIRVRLSEANQGAPKKTYVKEPHSLQKSDRIPLEIRLNRAQPIKKRSHALRNLKGRRIN